MKFKNSFFKKQCFFGAVVLISMNFFAYTTNAAAESNSIHFSSNFIVGYNSVDKSNSKQKVVENNRNIIKAASNLKKASITDAKFDLRDHGGITPVKNQLSYGSCWAFSATSALESYLLYSDQSHRSYDFSENNMMNLNGYDGTPYTGGNSIMSTAYYTRWSGPVLETQDPYPTVPDENTGLTAAKHVQNVIFIPSRVNSNGSIDNSMIKKYLTSNGGIETSIYWPSDSELSSYFNTTTKSLNYNGTNDSNHSVTIVGWDDNYPASNFANIAAGNGAFIVKNNWGTSWGDGGYFYVSYYDKYVGNDGVIYKAEDNNNYKNIYQWDDYGDTLSSGYNTQNIWYSNVFTAKPNDAVTAAGFYTYEQNSSYEIYLVPQFVDKNSLHNRILEKTGILTDAGYNTVKWDNPIPLSSGSKFAVLVKVTSPSGKATAGFEGRIAGYTSNAASEYNQSFVSSDGQSWQDAHSFIWNGIDNMNVCLKAYTINYSTTPTIVASDVSNNQGNVPLLNKLSFYFNLPLVSDSNFQDISLNDDKGRSLGSASINSSALIISIPTGLEFGTNYTVNIPSNSVKDISGNTLGTTIQYNFSTGTQPYAESYRESGLNRFATSAAVAKCGWQKSDYAILATGEIFPDALSAATLAKKYSSPILLTNSQGALATESKQELLRMSVKHVIIIGGPGAVSINQETEINNMGIATERIYGSDRYATSLEIAKYMKAKFGLASKVIVATGNNFADALSIASYAATKGYPIILTDLASIQKNSLDFIKNCNPSNTYVVGGTGVVSNAVLNQLPNAVRLGGMDRYETNTIILNYLNSEINLTKVYLATGEDFPDALSGSALAALNNSPIVIVSNNLSNNTSNYIHNNLSEFKVKYVIGGIGVVNQQVVGNLFK